MFDSSGGPGIVVAKKVKARAKKMGRPKVPDPRRSIASFRGSTAFAEWFEDLVRRERVSAASLIERALAEYARKIGHPEPPGR
ncbi:MAG TPA: hypothetical protein VG406_03665 [Isosphaeraceae bacterium]|jgi:hypothetical protein|nr:hypothetical protein [Isosphaeraceae bacterium]